LIGFNPSHQNSGGIPAQAHQGNPGSDLAKNLLFKNPGADV
jgi:hypothetical protein